MARSVTLICGPSCSGKTTLAHQLAQPGDLVLDLDDIAVRLGSPRRWRHDPAIAEQAEQHMRLAMRRLARTDNVTAYVIRCLPHPGHRARLAHALGAEVHVLVPPMHVALARAKRDHRPAGTASSIRWWYRTYRPSEVDRPWPLDPASTAAPSATAVDARPTGHIETGHAINDEARQHSEGTTRRGSDW